MGVFGVVDSKFRFGMGNDLKELDEDDHLGDDDDQSNLSSSSSSDVSNSSDFMEDVSSSSSSSSSLNQSVDQGPLYQMSSIMSQLPFKRGLSKHYEGKSQSFTSLAEATCLQDLVKPENPYNKRLKSCKSYGGDLAHHAHRSYPPVIRSGLNKKGSSRGSCGSLMLRRNSSLFFDHTSKPPIATTQTQKINMS